MSVKEKYQQALATGKIFPDPQQQQVVAKLDEIVSKLSQSSFRLPLLKKEPLQGLFLWGPVGAGKTWLMDLFYDSLTEVKKKERLHFHNFMYQVHQQLKLLQGQRDPLLILAKRLAKTVKVLCFDEFFVNDIADAMLLAGLLKALFAEGIVLIATSNIAPDQLYRNGLQRERFLPAIALIKRHTLVVELQSHMDYRLRQLEQAGLYHYPLNEISHNKMQQHFQEFAAENWESHGNIKILNRLIPTIAVSNEIVWFDFKILCHSPRSQNDYIEIAQQFKIVLVSGVPQFSHRLENEALYFIHLVDVFYDAKVKLILSAAVPLSELYQGQRWQQVFKRTLSRLTEMQSHVYLDG